MLEARNDGVRMVHISPNFGKRVTVEYSWIEETHLIVIFRILKKISLGTENQKKNTQTHKHTEQHNTHERKAQSSREKTGRQAHYLKRNGWPAAVCLTTAGDKHQPLASPSAPARGPWQWG